MPEKIHQLVGYPEKAKPAVRRGQKATGLSKKEKTAGLPGMEAVRFFNPVIHFEKNGDHTAMKKIAIFSLILAFGFIIVQPLQANTVAYTVQGDFSKTGTDDPLGIGTGTGNAVFNFTLAPPPRAFDTTPEIVCQALFTPLSLTLTLSGTNADATYTSAPPHTIIMNNFFSSSGSGYDSLSFSMDLQISGITYLFHAGVNVPLSFWVDGAVPPLPKLLSQSDVLGSSGQIEDYTTPPYKVLYDFSDLTVSSQVVPLPPTLVLLGTGLLGLGVVGWRRKRRN